jgi:ribonucleoside-diphosphate reductase alpha chain
MQKEREFAMVSLFQRPNIKSNWPDNALEILRMRYLLKDEDGNIVESADDRCWSVAVEIGRAELSWKSKEETEQMIGEFYRLMVERKFVPNSPTMMNAGKNNNLQYSACYVLPVEDSISGIFESIKNAAIIHKSGGGTGFSFSRIRPRDDMVSTTKGVASGPVSFMKVFDAATESLKQGGTRRGANMGILRVDHPDILEFVDCKLNGEVSNFNISVAITEEFMGAYERDETYALVSPKTGKEVIRLNAREVFQKIVNAAWQTGDPGLIFIDRINTGAANPIPACGPVESTNPCGEQPLYPYESCNLGSINLGLLLKDNDIDYKELDRVIRLSVRFLDDVIERNPFPLKQIDDIVKNNRRIGLGVMGWADLLFQLRMPYESEEALQLGEKIMQFIEEVSHDESRALAEERGVFPRWSESTYKEKYPLRNSTVTTIAPTGTISIIAGCSSGIEPIFGLYFKHRLGFEFFNPYFEQTMREEGYWSETLKDHVRKHGSIATTNLPEELKNLFKTAHEIPPEWHVRMQAAFQKFTDNAVSKTINLPNSAGPEAIGEAYSLAYKTGCLGITVYRDGCKPLQVLTHGTKAPELPAVGEAMKGRPDVLLGRTIKIESPHGTVYTTVNENSHGEAFEIFVNVGKAGSDVAADAEALGRSLSLMLRMPSPLTAEQRVDLIVRHLQGIGGSRDVGFGQKRVRSVPDAIARALQKYLESKAEMPKSAEVRDSELPASLEIATGNLCVECGSPTVKEEGCEKCHSCGWSNC